MGDSDNEDGGDLHATTDDVEATVRLKLNDHDEGGDDVERDGHVNVGEDEGESESQSGASSSVGGGKRRKKKRKKKSRKEKKEKKKAKKEKRKKRISDETADDEDEDQRYHQQEVDEESEEQQQQQPDGSNVDFGVDSEELKKRCDILANLPPEITDRFLEVGFGKWDKQWLPVLELGPYDVKGGVQDQWMHHYESNLEKEMGRVMPRLVYWYGVPKERSNEAFSFLAPNSVVTYEEGVERGLNKLSAKVQKKVNKNGKLTKPEKDLILGLQQIEIDHALAKDDRMAWMKDEPSPPSPPPLKKTKKKKGSAQSAGGKSERAKVGDVGPGDIAEEGEDSAKKYPDAAHAESEEDAGRKKKKRKQTPKSEKSKRQKTDEAVPPPEESSQLSAEPPRSEEDADHSMSMDQELSDDEEKANEEPEEEEEYKAEEDEDDDEEEFEPERRETKRKRLSKGKPAKKKVAKAKAEVEEDDGLTVEQRKARDKKRERDRLYRAKQREQRMFEENEEIFLPEMRRLEGAVDENDAKAAMKCLIRLQSLIPDITPSFIEGHGIGLLVKRTRTSFESDKAIKSKCKGITNAMKIIYNEKKKNIPDGFVPKKSTAASYASEQQPKAEKSVDLKKSKKEPSTGKQAENQDLASAEIQKDTLMDAPIPVKERAHEQGRQPSEALDVTTGGTSQVDSRATSSKATPATESSAKPSQPARKAFSLKTMLHGPKPAVASKSPGVPPDRTASSVTNVSQRGQRQRKILPAWLTEVSEEDPPSDDMRKFAIELLETTGECFPTETINPRAFVRNVESAVYALSRKESATNFTEYYWDKITEIVGAIKGKFVTGTIAKEIADGNFPTAKDLANLESAKFFDSFEGL